MRVRFLRQWEWRPRWGVVIVWAAGWSGPVKRVVGEAAIEAGAAELVPAQKEA